MLCKVPDVTVVVTGMMPEPVDDVKVGAVAVGFVETGVVEPAEVVLIAKLKPPTSAGLLTEAAGALEGTGVIVVLPIPNELPSDVG